jgi:hypothetical protein
MRTAVAKTKCSRKPVSVKFNQDLEAEIRKICEVNNLGISAVVNLCCQTAVPIVKSKLLEMRHGHAKAA